MGCKRNRSVTSHGCDSFFAVAKKLIYDISETVNGIEFVRRKGRENGTNGNHGTDGISLGQTT